MLPLKVQYCKNLWLTTNTIRPSAHSYSSYEWVVMKIRTHGSIQILQRNCLFASSIRSINTIWNAWNVALKLEQKLAIAVISFNSSCSFIFYLTLFLWISFLKHTHIFDVQQKINWISWGGLDLLDFIRPFLCSIICNQLWKANFQVLNAVSSTAISFSAHRERCDLQRKCESSKWKKKKKLLTSFVHVLLFLWEQMSEREPIRGAWLITIWCIECISNMLNCCDNSNWSMSENQQMSNLIECRHRNQIEQKIKRKRIKIEKETKQINKTPASSHRFNFDTRCAVHLNVCLSAAAKLNQIQKIKIKRTMQNRANV